MSRSCRCPSCDAVTEQWWSYCAMCGWHIASGRVPHPTKIDAPFDPVAQEIMGGTSRTPQESETS